MGPFVLAAALVLAPLAANSNNYFNNSPLRNASGFSSTNPPNLKALHAPVR